MKVKEWCIALDNVSPYIDSILGLRYKFLKGERATKEKVFGMIPSMTEEEYARYFRPATEEEINGEFEWDGEQYVLIRSESMKSNIKHLYPMAENIKEMNLRICNSFMDEMAKQYGQKNYVYWNGLNKGFELGANAVLEEISKFIHDMPLGTDDSRRKYAVLYIQSKVLDKIEELRGE